MSAIAERWSLRSLEDAFGLLSVLPVRRRELDRERAGRAMLLAPLVGIGIAVFAAIAVVLMRFGLEPSHFSVNDFFGRGTYATLPDNVNPLTSVVGLGVVALLTRGLHIDGLADTVDALASYRGKEDALAIMRKPDLGPLGMVAVVFVLLAQVGALTHCINLHRGTASIVIALMTARLAMTLACTPRTPAARPDGLGALVAGTVPSRSALIAAVVTGAVAVGAAAGDIHTLGRFSEIVHAAVAVVLGCVVAHVVRAHCVRRLGGITGDVLGCIGEITTTVVLVTMAFGV